MKQTQNDCNINVEENADVESFSLKKIQDGKCLMIGDYRSIFLEKGSNEVNIGKKNTLPEHLEA